MIELKISVDIFSKVISPNTAEDFTVRLGAGVDILHQKRRLDG